MAAELTATHATAVITPTSYSPDQMAPINAQLHGAQGRSVALQGGSSSSGWNMSGTGQWQQLKLGPQPDQHTLALRAQVELDILSALGIPPGIQGTEGTVTREAYRQFNSSGVQPIARIVEAELSIKFETPVSLSFRSLGATDVVSKSRAMKGMVDAGVPLEKAMAIAFDME